MIGQVISGQKYNLIILAGGKGVRMGETSQYIPKALVPIGSQRAIDWIIAKHEQVSGRIIIGTGTHGDLLENYILGKNYKNIFFSEEKELSNNAISAMYALDLADSRLPTIITFCDLLIMDSVELKGDMAFYVDEGTEGNLGTFRHSVFKGKRILENSFPEGAHCNGVLGYFVFEDTVKLKEVVYSVGLKGKDLTSDVVMKFSPLLWKCSKVFEFGTENDLKKVRELWEQSL